MAEAGHNSGLSPEEAAASMERALAPYAQRRDEFVRKAESGTIVDMEAAEAAVDFVRMARALAEKARQLRDEVTAPYTEAVDAARGVALRFIDAVEASAETMNNRLGAYQALRRQKADELAAQQRAAEEELRRQAAARDGGEPDATPPAPSGSPPPSRRKAPAIRTALGGRMSEIERFRAKVVDVAKVPEHVLKAPRVIEAIERVAYDLLKNGIEVPGVEKETYTSHSIS